MATNEGKDMRIHLPLIVIFLTMLCGVAFCQSGVQMIGARSAGMGGASVAIADDAYG